MFEDISRDAAEGRQRLMRMGVGEDDFVIGIVGSIDHCKNQIDGIRILRAFPVLGESAVAAFRCAQTRLLIL